MTEPDPAQFTGTPTVEEVMVALAKQSIFDLPTLARKIVGVTQEKAEAENDPAVADVLVHSTYVLWHSQDVTL